MALNNISTEVAGDGSDPIATKLLRRADKLALAQAKRSTPDTPGYRVLNSIVGTFQAYVNGPNGATLTTIDGTASPTVGHPWTTGGTPPPSGNDFFFSGDQNNWIINGGLNVGSTFSTPAPENPSYTYPDNSYTGKTYNFTGTEWMSSMNLKIGGSWTTTAITVDFWFYPTANDVQLLSESDHSDVTSGYHYSMLEIGSDGKVHAKFYNETYPSFEVVSNNAVELNAWNHIWFQETATGDHNFTLNNVAVTGTANYTRIPPIVAEYFVIGDTDSTNMGRTGRFQGKIGYLTIHDYDVASTWNAQNARFRPVTVYPQRTNYAFDFTNPPTSGTIWNDSTNQVSATINGTLSRVSNYGGGLFFDGSSTYLEIEDITDGISVLTISMAADFESANGNWNVIYSGGGYGGNDIFAYISGGNADSISVGTGETLNPPGAIVNTGLAWWDFVYSNTSVTVYKNGVQVLTGTIGQSNIGFTSPLLVGQRYGSSGDFLNGTIYRIKGVFTALDSTAIATQYNAVRGTYGLPAIPSGPTSITAYVNGWNGSTNALEPDTSGNPDLSAVTTGWTVTGPNGFTATVVSSMNAGPNWYIVVDVSLAGFTGDNVANYTFTSP